MVLRALRPGADPKSGSLLLEPFGTDRQRSLPAFCSVRVSGPICAGSKSPATGALWWSRSRATGAEKVDVLLTEVPGCVDLVSVILKGNIGAESFYGVGANCN